MKKPSAKPAEATAANPPAHRSPQASDTAILNHAARVLASLTPGLHADTALRQYFAYWHRLGPREKRAISHAIFIYFRWLRWLDTKENVPNQIAAALAIHDRFMANPASVKIEAIAAWAMPDWVREEVVFPPESLRQLQQPSALWLRARAAVASTLMSQLPGCVPAPALQLSTPPLANPVPSLPATALRYTGNQDLFLTPQFHSGLFEIQDLASQLVGHACSPTPGETWWDACAGEGGKTLHLADLMQNKGLLWASDRSHRRLQALKRRAARAQVFNYRAAHWEGTEKLPTKTKFDGVLVDAPCSGIGTWQRNPHARWTTSGDDVRELAIAQRDLLNRVAPSLKAGGRLVYAVCTLTRSETTDIVDAFTAAHPEFEPTAVFKGTDNTATHVTLWPHELNANGMFIAAWRRK